MMYTLATDMETRDAIRWALSARVAQLLAEGKPLDATLPPELLKKAMDDLLQQWRATAANKRRHGEASPMTESSHVIKGRFKAWARLVFGDLMILQSIVITGEYSGRHLDAVAKIRTLQREQTMFGNIVAPRAAAGKDHQNNRKWMKWLENQLRSRGAQVPRHRGSASSRSVTDSGPTCAHCHYSSNSTCQLCCRPLCRSCRRGGVCLNTGDCRNFRNPPATMGKGKGRGKGMTTQEMLEKYEDVAKKVERYVNHTGLGRRPDGSWGSGALAARGSMWLTAPEFRATGICSKCKWEARHGTSLYRCCYCHMELCQWHAQWVAGLCRCGGGCY